MISPATGAPELAGAAPEIAAESIVDIFAKLAPFTFGQGIGASIAPCFDEYFEKVTFSLTFHERFQAPVDPEPFLASLRSAADVIADRLSAARAKARANGTVTIVSLEGMVIDPAWPEVAITAEPYTPWDEDDDDEEWDLDD